MGNPVWERYVYEQMPSWMDWLKNNHLKSHVELMSRFIITHPYYIPDETPNEKKDLFINMIFNKEYIEKLTDKGISVWYYSSFSDFLEALKPYAENYKDFELIMGQFTKYLWWYSRVYTFLRHKLYIYIVDEKGRNIE